MGEGRVSGANPSFLLGLSSTAACRGLSSDVAAVEIDLSSHLFLRNRHFTNFLSEGYMLWKQKTVLWTLVLNCPSLRG